MKKLFIIILTMAAAAACAKEGFEIQPAAERMRFEVAGTEGMTGSKSYLTDGFAVCWEKDVDQVCIFNKNDKYLYTAACTGTSTWLEGSAVPVQSTYYALYPYDEQATNSTGIVTTTLPAIQKAVKGQYSNIIAVAATKTKEFSFKNCVSLVEVDLQTEGVSSISFRGNNGELVAGRLRMTVSTSGAPDPTIVSGTKEVTVSNGGAILDKGIYYLAIAPQVFHNGITVSLSGPGGSASKITTTKVNAARSARVRTGALSLTLTPEDTGFSLEYSDSGSEGIVYPGEDKYLIYSYSGTNSLQYKINSPVPVSIEIPDGSAQLETVPVAEEGIINLLPTKSSGGENENVLRLRNAAFRGSEYDPVNLPVDNATLMGASQGGSCTANCYIVTSPGVYAFPLVYGNALKGGSDNPQAYNPGAGGKAISPFVGADGKPITGPFINDSDNKAVSARLEWEDAVGLVQKISLSGGRIFFTVPKETIREGNAVISALNADGEVVWSWHIWVCGASAQEFTPVTISNKAGKTFKMCRLNIGWVAPYDTPVSYAGATTRILIKQEGTGKTIAVTFLQTGAELPANLVGNSTFYQFGRKDPFVSGDGTPCEPADNGSKKTWYTSSRRDTVGTRAAEMAGNIAEYIKHPSVYNLNSGGDGQYSNAWNGTQQAFISSATSDAASSPVVKTIYDPSPSGCCLPPAGAFTAFSKDNTQGEFNYGYTFYSAPDKAGETIFFPAVGSMSTSNTSSTKVYAALRNVGTGFSYWTATPNNATAAFNLNCYNKGAVNYTYGSNRQYVFPVRPILEQ